MDWAAERLRGQASVIDEVTVLWRMLGDALETRSLGPLDELGPTEVGELVDRLRVVVAELGAVVQSSSDPEPAGRTPGVGVPERT